MFSHHLMLALRSLLKHRSHTALNLCGLTIAMTACVLTMLYVEDELSYDRHHQHAANLFRLTTDHNARTPAAPAAYLKQYFPEVSEAVRLRSTIATWLVASDDIEAYEERVYWTEGSLFDVFTIPFVSGDPATALTGPDKAVVSESMARKYFGNDDPVGKVLRLDNTFHFTISGVMEDFPTHSHFTADLFLSFTQGEAEGVDQHWGTANYYTYLRLHDGAAAPVVASRLQAYVDTEINPANIRGMQNDLFELQPVTSIHLYSNLINELETNGSITYIYILVTGAVFLLLIAQGNFINLSLVHAAARIKEAGLMNILGAGRVHTALQHVTGSMLISGLNLMLVIVLAHLALPAFNALTGKALSLDFTEQGAVLTGLFAVAAFTGLVSGGGVALVLSGVRPMDALSNRISATFDYPLLKRALVTAQFVLSGILITSTGVVYGQLRYMLDQPLGFDKRGLIVSPLTLAFFSGGIKITADGRIEQKSQTLKNEMVRSPYITDVAFSGYVPGLPPGRGALLETMVRVVDERNTAGPDFMRILDVDEAFFETLGVDLVFGAYPKPAVPVIFSLAEAQASGFRPPVPPVREVALNETAARRIGFTSPEAATDRRIDMIWGGSRRPARIVGVVEDTHFRSLSHPVEPLVYRASNGTYMLVRLQAGNEAAAIEDLKRIWQSHFPQVPLTYTFLEDNIDRMYEPVGRLGRILVVCAMLAALLTALGVLNLVSLTLRQRTKEIGVRKILGAELPQIVWMLSKEFVVMAAGATLIAWPAAYWVMTSWLQDFAYRTAPSPALFLSVGLAVMVIATAAVCAYVLKGVRSNPVEALRYE